MKNAKEQRWLRVPCCWVLGLGALFLMALLSLQGQQTSNSVLVKVNQVQGTEPIQAFVEDEFIVVLKKEVRAGFRAVDRGSDRPQVNSPSLQNLIDRHGVGRFKRQFQTARTQPAGSNLPDLSGHYKVRVPRGSDLDAALADFANDPHVERVEKIGIHPLYLTPNDSFYSEQWHHRSPHGIDSDLVWNAQTGNGNVVVAVLDTGVHYQHPDLAGNIWTNVAELPGNGIDDDGNGYIDDFRGYDFVESATGASLFTCCDSDCSTADNDPDDNNGHGTHLAGIVAATTNNGFGVAGIAGGFGSGLPGSTSNGVKIMPLRIGWNGAFLGLLCGNGLIRMDYAAEALHYLADLKARGINIAAVNASWGSSDTGGLGAAVDEVLANDVMIIHAAGNSAENSADFLGSKVGAMSVAATNQNGAGADFTNFGDYVEISAPGVDITSLWVGPDPSTAYYATLSGTSMAAPHASAVAALLESLNPGLTAAQKFSLMVANTKPYVNDGRNLGSGILNANLALTAAGPPTPNFLVSASPGNRIVAVGNSATYDLTVTALSGFTGTVNFSATGLPFGAATSFSPGSVIGSGQSTMTVTTGPGTPLGTYPITITVASGSLIHTATVTLQVYLPGAALFVTTDVATQGTWKGVYGAQGYAIANDATSYPFYAQVNFAGQSNYTWAGSTTDLRALQKGAAS
ncbi:MAG: S8 family serine peptidase, partial [Acidobacteria bacterium]|nr:S8 family serine peptidase [Acidobacteriota bacterium]MCI0718657.1 S8 family serine peptidase [Acidobacteriota bacterium]